MRFRSYAELTPADLSALLPLVSEPKPLRKGRFLQHEGDRSTAVFLLLEGWTASSMSVADGARQLVKVHLAGDLVGLPGLPVTAAPDSVVALTDIVFSRVDMDAMGDLFVQSPRVAALLFLISQEERLMLMDRLTIMGQRDTAGRLAAFLLQLHARLRRQDPSIGETLRCPLTQANFADLIGATDVHTSRVVTQLRKRKVLSWSRNEIVIHNRTALRELAGLPERVVARNQPWLPKSE